MVAFFVFIMRQQGGGGKAMAFGKSRAKLAKQEDLKKIIGDENMYKGVLATIGGIGAMSTMFGQAAGGVQTAQAMTVNVRGVMTDEDGRVVGSIVNRDNERTNTSAGV